MTDGAIKSSGVNFSHGGRRKERLRGSRSRITGWAVAVAIGRSLGQPERVAHDHVLALGSGRGHHPEIGVRDPVLGREVTFGPVTHDVKYRGPGDQSVVGLVPING